MVNFLLDRGKPSFNLEGFFVSAAETQPSLTIFNSKGLNDVIGIDLFSEDPRIHVMDMHKLTFADNSFDIVYSSHSLEHSYALEQVVQEISRVSRNHALIAIEVPVRYPTTEADRHDLRNADGIMSLFSHCKTETLWSEDLEALTPKNSGGAPIVRVIFRIEK